MRVKSLRGESHWLNTNITVFKRDPSSPAAPQDDIYDTFSAVSPRPPVINVQYAKNLPDSPIWVNDKTALDFVNYKQKFVCPILVYWGFTLIRIKEVIWCSVVIVTRI